MSAKKKHYEIADKAWQCVVGCSPCMSCAPRCWARKTVARIVECQKSSNPERAEFFQIALTPEKREWSGVVQLDEDHIGDPIHWPKPAVVATGFHGDWGWLEALHIHRMLGTMVLCPHHEFMPLSKEPDRLVKVLSAQFVAGDVQMHANDLRNIHRVPQASAIYGRIDLEPEDAVDFQDTDQWPPKHVSIGCSVMNQSEAYKMLPHMKRISELGWRTHVWYEPALGPVDWSGWQFIELLIMGGESDCGGFETRPCDIQWFRDSIRWCRANAVRSFVKQLGSKPIQPRQNPDATFFCQSLRDRKGGNPKEWPEDLRIREMPGME